MRLRFPFMVFCAYNMVQPANAGQAIPNSLVTLSSPVVRVSDLFANAGPEAGRILGPAPPPGNRIVVEEPQLATIAASYQVPWTPDGSNPEVVLASPGSALPLAPIDNAIADAVANAGGPANAAITLPDFIPPMVPLGAAPGITVTRISFDAASNGFSASLVITADGMAPQDLDLTGLALPSVRALVASHDLAPGEILSASDVSYAALPRNQAGSAVADASDAIGMAVDAPVPAGAAVAADNLSAPIVVKKGAFVVLNLSVPGLLLTAQGVALGAGGVGGVIPVLNPASRAVVQAVITGPGAADIAPGSAPLSAPEANGGNAGAESYAQAHGGSDYQSAMVPP